MGEVQERGNDPDLVAGEKRALAPTELPESFEARFVSFVEAREADSKKRARIKKKKAPKEQLLPLVPSSEHLAGLAETVRCSSTRTEGWDTFFQVVQRGGGGSLNLRVHGYEEVPDPKGTGQSILLVKRIEPLS